MFSDEINESRRVQRGEGRVGLQRNAPQMFPFGFGGKLRSFICFLTQTNYKTDQYSLRRMFMFNYDEVHGAENAVHTYT